MSVCVCALSVCVRLESERARVLACVCAPAPGACAHAHARVWLARTCVRALDHASLSMLAMVRTGVRAMASACTPVRKHGLPGGGVQACTPPWRAGPNETVLLLTRVRKGVRTVAAVLHALAKALPL